MKFYDDIFKLILDLSINDIKELLTQLHNNIE